MKVAYSLIALALVSAAAQAQSAADACAALQQAGLYRTVITAAQWQADGVMEADASAALSGASAEALALPPHCLVHGDIEPRTGADGKPYATKFELRLPEKWNGKLLFQGGGGLNGSVRPAYGTIPSRGSTATPALLRGYAVVSTDTGHQGQDAAFAADQQARLDYAYTALGKVTDAAKQLIQKHYGDYPAKSFYMGCSNGGREAMLVAQRYPLEFEGVIAGNPGFRLSRAAIAQAWDNRHFMAAAPVNAMNEKIFSQALTQADLDALAQGVLARCDDKDGLADGLINAWESCDFSPDMVADKLGAEKVALVKTIFGGAKNSRGENVYASWPYDAGINGSDWRRWKLGDSLDAVPNARNITLGVGSLSAYFITPHSPDFDTFAFDFDRDVAKTEQIAGIHNADRTDLSTFKARGGKMIIFQGVSDPVFSAHDLRDWFVQLGKDTVGRDDFARLFMVPGMNHCGRGPSLDDIDPLTALEQWVENGKAPDYLLSRGKAFAGKEMPVCAYPKVATYTGGDADKAESFECR